MKRKWTHNAELTDDYVFFWGGYFSQWCHSPFVIDGIKFENAEKWMMYKKAMFFNDMDIAVKILAIDNPREIKQLGRQVRNFNKERWDEVAYDFVVRGNIVKFSQNPKMLKELLETGDRRFVEASPYDGIWGIAIGMQDPRRLDESKWRGLNLLGKALTEVREYLKNELKEENW